MKKYLNTLFVTTQGAYLSKEGETIVADPEGDKGKGKISTLAKFLESTLIKEAGAKLG